jgi:cytidine deaminase
MDRQTLHELLVVARTAAALAYAPASKFTVGAAVLGANGRVYRGCNVENASYGLTVCAERNAVFHAVAEGCRQIEAVAVWTPCLEPASPCGACRQVLYEFVGPRDDLDVILGGTGDVVVETTLRALLPRPFRFGR